ncbi:MAG TPA: NADP-dependent oxidoreductase, partial [Thermoanaerobaculia bacterium]|nr:NADP-dependent oxidoreductase [Thermoanaerobaculia bacterium]
MKAVRVHRFGGLDAIEYEEVTVPAPEADQVLVKVRAAGVGPWDAWVREGKSALPQPLPLTLGSDLAGVVESVGAGVAAFRPGEEVFGVTNARFTGANAEYAVAEAGMLAAKPRRLTHLEAASVPVVASTAWQMVWDHGAVGPAKIVLVHGAAGNVGAYAVQLAKRAGARVLATVRAGDADRVRALGADRVIDADAERFEEAAGRVDVVLDTLGG